MTARGKNHSAYNRDQREDRLTDEDGTVIDHSDPQDIDDFSA
jgi:hypothetical protein